MEISKKNKGRIDEFSMIWETVPFLLVNKRQKLFTEKMHSLLVEVITVRTDQPFKSILYVLVISVPKLESTFVLKPENIPK